MDKNVIFNLLVNVYPLIMIILLSSFIVAHINEYEILEILFFPIFTDGEFLISLLILTGYGNIVPVILILIIYIISFVLEIIYTFEDWDIPINDRLACIVEFTLIVLFLLHGIYVRLREKGILVLSFIDILKIFLDILENEWFRGVGIGVISTVIGGLILNKISKK